MTEGTRRLTAMILAIVSGAGAIAYVDYASTSPHSSFANVCAAILAGVSLLFFIVAMTDGGESAAGDRNVHTEIHNHIHGQPAPQQPYPPQAQPIYYPMAALPPAATGMPPEQVMAMMADMQRAHTAQIQQMHAHAALSYQPAPALPPPSARYMGAAIDVTPGHALSRLTAAPDGRYIAPPKPSGGIIKRSIRRMVS